MAKGRKQKVIDITPNDTLVSSELAKHIESKSLPVAIQEKIVSIMSPVFLKLEEWDTKVESIVIEDENDKQGMLTAAESRKFVKRTRIDVKNQVEQEVSIIKEEMQPYLDHIEGWNTVFKFAEALMKTIETKAGEKEKFAENLRLQKINNLRTERTRIAEPFKLYIGYNLDFGIISEDEFDAIIHNAKLAKKTIDDAKELEKKEQEKKEKELENERRYIDRLNMIYSLGMVKGDKLFYYKDYHVLEDTIKDTEDFDTLFTGIENKVNLIKAEEKKIKDEEDRIKNDAIAAEAKKIKDQAERDRLAAEAKRQVINDRISEIHGAIIKRDALYVKYDDGTEAKVIDYDVIYSMDHSAWINFVTYHNNQTIGFNNVWRTWKENDDRFKIEQAAKELADKAQADKEAKQRELADQIQSEMNDSNRIKLLITCIQEFKNKIDKDFIFTSHIGNTVKIDVLTLLGKIIDYTKSKM